MIRAFTSPRHARACSILSPFFSLSPKSHYLMEEDSPGCSQSNRSHGDLSLSPTNFAEIAETAISKCRYLKDNNRGKSVTSFLLKDYLIGLSSIYPDIVRRFWRISVLRPQDVFDILLVVESDEVGVKTVEYVWGIFNWASGQSEEFKHFPRSCKIMASMLARVGLFSEAELLLSRRDMEGILLECKEVFDNLIEGYLGDFELGSAFSVYVRMRRVSLVPSLFSYCALIKHLIELNETKLMHNIYVDMLMMGLGMGESVEEKQIHEDVIRLLCMDGKVQESRVLVKKLTNYGIKPSDLAIDAIIRGHCAKKDYNDVLSFLAEVAIAPEAVVGNKILFSLCRDFGVDQTSEFLQKLEELGFCPSEISLGILIGFCCHEGKLKKTFFYLSDILSRGLKPHVYSYNAILSAMFKEGMWMLTRDILAEMSDMGVACELSTFRVLLAGFCKARKFDEMKTIVYEMADHNLVTLSSLEDPLNKGFMLLGLDPLGVRIKRDNDKGFSKTEFYDDLGNGLYLDTDLDKFEKRIAQVLDNAMVPDFSSSIIENCQSSDIRTLMIVDEMVRWGQEMSLSALSSLLNCLSRVPASVDTINHHLGVMSKSFYDLDQKTLNMLIRTYSKMGFSFKARTLFDGLLRRGYHIDNSTYFSLLFCSCKKGDLKSFHYFCKLMHKSNQLPEVKDCNALLIYLCRNKWINEALELFKAMLFVGTYSDISDTFQSLLGKLCHYGFTNTASVLLNEFSNRATLLDHMAYSHLIIGFCLENKLPEALKLFEMMLSMNLFPPLEVYTELIFQLCRTNNLKKTIDLKNTCLRYQPYAVLSINSAVIRGFCKSGRAEEASGVFHRSLLKGLFPDADVFNSLIEGYCRVHNLNKVRELLGFMLRKNINIFVSSYSNMSRLLCAEGRFTLAISLKELMLRVELPELILHNIMIFHLSSLRNSSLLDAVIKHLQMKGIPFNDVTYNYVVRGYMLCNNIPCSLHYLTDMIAQDLKPNHRSLQEVIHSLCCNGELLSALNLSREMESRGWIHSSSVQTSIVVALLSNGNLQQAVEFLDRMASEDLNPDNVQYDYLIKIFCQHGRLDKAVDLVNIMLQKGSSPTSTSYDYLVQGLCNARKLDTALDFYTEMLCWGKKPGKNTWDVLVCRLSEYGWVEEGEEVLKSGIRLSEVPSQEAFCAVIDGYRAEKNVGKTFEVMKLMQEKGHVPDFDTHWSLVSNLSNSSKGDESSKSNNFLSGLLSGFGYARKIPNTKMS